MTQSPLRIIQISDTHLFAEKDKILLGVNTYESFHALIQLLKKDPKPPHRIILSGDLSQDGSEKSYQHMAECLETLNVPIYYLPGNHDNREIMTRILPRENILNIKHIVLEHWQLILLDSKKRESVEGYLDETELHFLQQSLKRYKDHPAIVFFHHPPVSVGCDWLDPLGLTNSEEFWEIACQYPNMHTVSFGHVHQECDGEKEGIRYFSTPSTCIQFKTKSAEFALEKLPPAYRWIDLYPNSKLKTGVCRLPDYIGEFDDRAKGY